MASKKKRVAWNKGQIYSEERRKSFKTYWDSLKGKPSGKKGKKQPQTAGKNNPMWKPKVKKVCPICNKQFEVVEARRNTAKYCSFTCFSKSKIGQVSKRRNGVFRYCETCGGKFYTPKCRMKIAKFCSISCSKKGKKPWNYIDGLGKRRKYGIAWDRIKLQIIKRDKGICQHCKKLGIDVDHIIPFRISKDNSTENLQLLCKSCHGKKTNWEAKYYG